MSSQCNATFDKLARSLGDFSCHDAPAVVSIRNPLELSNWTLPVLELTMVAGAVFALIYAVGRMRRAGDPTNLVLWFGSVVYLLVTEIPLYFPGQFGVEGHLGVVFAHNAFTVQFMYDRLPLYIVALYPAVATLAYEVVRSLGVFRLRGILVGAICVGFVHHCFYEVFDQLGPQLRWWTWNTDNLLNHPTLEAVPMTSVVIFAAIGPAVLIFLVQLFVGRKAERGGQFSGWSLVLRTLATGALVPIGVAILSLPASVFGGEQSNTTAQAIVFSVELGLFTIISVPVLFGHWLRARRDQIDDAAIPNEFVRWFGTIYLLVLATLWASALPQYFSAVHGITSDATPTGSLLYAVVCFVAAALCVVGAGISVPRRAAGSQPITVAHTDR